MALSLSFFADQEVLHLSVLLDRSSENFCLKERAHHVVMRLQDVNEFLVATFERGRKLGDTAHGIGVEVHN